MVSRYSVQQLNQLSKKREVWCWGCGFRLGIMIKNYSEEPFMKKVVGLIDSNKKNQSQIRKIADKELSISAPDVIKKQTGKILLIISSDADKSIYDNARELYKDIDVVYSIYPTVYHTNSNLIKKICCKLPYRRNLLFYVGSDNSQPHENAEAIRQYLDEECRENRYKLVYLSDYPCDMPSDVVQISLSDIKNKSSLARIIRHYYWYSTSKYIMYESTSIEKIRDSQIKIYLNHGTIPLKNVKDALAQPEDLSYAVCPGKGCAKFYKDQYRVPDDKLFFAMPPRVKQLFVDAREDVDTVFNSKDKQIILWLPTFRRMERSDKSERSDSTVSNPVIELLKSNDMVRIHERLLINNQILIIKCHPREKEIFVGNNQYENIIICTDNQLLDKGINTHQLMNRSEAMISDYSGVTFEYMLLDRVIGYFIPDYDAYSRGFAVDAALSYMPGTKMKTADDVIVFLESLKNGKDDYKEQRNHLKERLFGDVDVKNGARDLIRFIEETEKW